MTFGQGEVNQTTLSTGESQEIFFAQYAATGDLLWARQGAGSGGSGVIAHQGQSISMDAERGVSYVAGNFSGANTFGLGEPNETTLVSAGGQDIFLLRLASDVIGPITSNVVTDPNPAQEATSVTVTALVDDTATGGSLIASAEYTIGGSPPAAMQATDGSFDQPVETVAAQIPPQPIGVHEVCVRGVDSSGNVGAFDCIFHVVEGADLMITKTSVVTPITVDIANTASVEADQVDPVTVDNVATNVSAVPLSATVAYTIIALNNGPSDATNVVVQDSVPREARVSSIAASQGSCRQMGRRVVCNLGTLTAGASATVTILAEAN